MLASKQREHKVFSSFSSPLLNIIYFNYYYTIMSEMESCGERPAPLNGIKRIQSISYYGDDDDDDDDY